MMPRKGLKTLSKIKACKGASGSPLGAGMRSTTASSTWSTPRPVFPLALRISSGRQPSRSTIWSFTSSGFAEGRSILLSTGMISRSCSKAR